MSQPRRKSSVTPSRPQDLKRFDEANSARLGLISVQERIPEDFTSWEVQLTIEGRDAYLTCVSPTEYGGVPHGLDGDFSTALNLMFIEQGAPDSGEVHTTAYQLLQRAGFADSGQYYQALNESLTRLMGAVYTAGESWRDHRQKRWTSVKFSIIDQIEADTEHSGQYEAGTLLKIRLARPVVQSIREQYLKPLDVEFVMSLRRPVTRSLYRMLDARRYDVTHPSEPVGNLKMSLLHWAQECKLIEEMPNKIKRNLEAAHTELIQRGYLRSVEYVGTRSNTMIHYEFGDLADQLHAAAQAIPDAPVVQALRQRGVAPSVARKLVADLGEQHVTNRLEKFETMLRGGYQARNPSALLVDVIKDMEGKYADPQGFASSVTQQQANERRLALAVAVQREAEQASEHLQEEFSQLPLKEQAARAITTVKMLVGRELREGHLRALLSAMLSGEVAPLEIQQGVIQAAHTLTLPEFAEQLRQLYSG